MENHERHVLCCKLISTAANMVKSRRAGEAVCEVDVGRDRGRR